jgi:excisionase family DNA binding protein
MARLLTRKEAAERLRLSVRTLRRWADEDRGPPFVKMGESRAARIRYPEDLFEEWIAAGATPNSPGARPTNAPKGKWACSRKSGKFVAETQEVFREYVPSQ